MSRLGSRLVLAVLLSSSFLLAPAAAQGQGGVSRFCESGMLGARISATGSADFTVNGGSGDLVLHATGLPTSTIGLFFYGGQAQAPVALGNGFLCVTGPPGPFRLSPVATSASTTSVSTTIDYLTPSSPAAGILPGSTWNAQFWFRSGASFDLTDALAIQFVPPQPITQSLVVHEQFRSGHPLGQTVDGGVVVMNTAAELQATWDLHSQGGTPSSPPPVNMDELTVIAAFTGRRFTTGYAMEIVGIDLSVTTLRVTTEERQPGSGCGTFASETQPVQFIAIRKVEGAALGEWVPITTTYTCP